MRIKRIKQKLFVVWVKSVLNIQHWWCYHVTFPLGHTWKEHREIKQQRKYYKYKGYKYFHNGFYREVL